MFSKTDNPYRFKYLITGISGPGIEAVYLPPEPPEEEILFKKEQRFVRPEMSDQMKIWVREMLGERKKNPEVVHARQEEINAWEEQEWERSQTGIWFWNDGEKIYITGDHYKYLTTWEMYFGFPDFWDADKEIFYWTKYWEEDDESYGGTLNTLRRGGKSGKMGFWIANRCSTNFKHFGGMQGEDNTKIQSFYTTFVQDPFYKLPYYFQPEYDTNSLQKKGIIFKIPPKRHEKNQLAYSNKVVLESQLDYRTSEANKYDQAALHSFVNEEGGKCHPAGTEVRMFDGTLKKVEEVTIGDKLMGDDSTPRDVINTGTGFGKIYKIIPNSKAEPWYVNEDHILSCKLSKKISGFKKGDVLNIPIRQYMKMSITMQNHLMCYRVSVEYPAKQHNVDPYFLGVWLGDGSSRSPEITNVDSEIVDWLNYHCKQKGFTLTKKSSKNRTQTYYVKGGMGVDLKNIGLIKNKHIPDEYLIDSRQNRLNLLAGIIDTDGHKKAEKNRRKYEIIQKRKDLAIQIKELAMSLGFYCSMYEKTATMKRKNGSMYSCKVYRLSIYGLDLSDIPCRVGRKQIDPNITKYNSKDSTVYGFTVAYDRMDYYYGFNITGNHLYVLKDYTVTHNTVSVSVWERWKFVKPCLRRGKYIRGKAYWGTTVEYMDVKTKGGKAYQRLCLASDYNKRGKDGRTESGLYAALMPADCMLEGFIDDHGRPQRKGAMQWILDERESVENNPKDYADLVRKYPLNWNEVFYVSADKCEFNVKILQDRKAELQINPPPLRRFTASWEGNKRFSKISLHDDPVNGWLKMSALMEKEKWNDVGVRYVGGQPIYFPKNDNIFRLGLDPIDHGVVVEGDLNAEGFGNNRRSRPVLLGKRLYDSSIDGQLNEDILIERARIKFPYKTGIQFVMMDQRPNDPNIFFERTLMICWLLSCKVHVESQKPGVINWFKNNGCGEFLWQKYVPDESKMKKSDFVEGTAASPMIIQEYTSAIATDVEYFGHTYPFIEVVEDDLLFDPQRTREYDYTVAQGNMELAARMRDRKPQLPVLDLDQYFHRFDSKGRVLN